MTFTPSLFRVLWRRLSSVEVVLCTAFFFLRTVPLPPVLTCAALDGPERQQIVQKASPFGVRMHVAECLPRQRPLPSCSALLLVARLLTEGPPASLSRASRSMAAKE
jgi:hypothetical protein